MYTFNQKCNNLLVCKFKLIFRKKWDLVENKLLLNILCNKNTSDYGQVIDKLYAVILLYLKACIVCIHCKQTLDLPYFKEDANKT